MTFQGVDPLVLALFLGSLSLMPMLLIICTSFLKIVIVLMITRNAIGVQQVPPSMAINGIALAGRDTVHHGARGVPDCRERQGLARGHE